MTEIYINFMCAHYGLSGNAPVLPPKAHRDIEGEGTAKDVAQLAYAIGKAIVGTKKSKQKARSDFVKGAKSSIK